MLVLISCFAGAAASYGLSDRTETVDVDKEKLIGNFNDRLKQMIDEYEVEAARMAVVEDVRQQFEEQGIKENDTFFYDTDTNMVFTIDENGERKYSTKRPADAVSQEQMLLAKGEVDYKAIALRIQAINSIDSRYLFDMVDAGVTGKEQASIEAYLKERLSDGDYTTAKDLFNQYAQLLQ